MSHGVNGGVLKRGKKDGRENFLESLMEKNPTIKFVSLSSDQHNGNGKPIILFAILSRTQIEKNDRDKLFSALVDREASPYNQASFKLSLSIDEVLRPLLFKYERVYNSEKLL